MIAFLLKTAFRMLATAALLYGAFVVRVGNYTLYQHGHRIALTPEAQELTDALTGQVDDSTLRLREHFAEEATAILTDRLGNPEAPGYD